MTKEASKQFFFEKKNQKTFDSAVANLSGQSATARLKAFCFFFSKKKAFLAFFLVLSATPAQAISDPREMLPNPIQEAHAEQLGSLLRCLVCQNESIEDSNADLARDLRAIVRQRIRAGETDSQIMAWMVARYGNFVRLRPPLSAATFLRGFAAPLALLAGAAATLLGRRHKPAAPPPLTEAEQARLAELSRTACPGLPCLGLRC